MGLLALLILIVGIIVPIVQNGRAIQRLESVGVVDFYAEPGFFWESLPSACSRGGGLLTHLGVNAFCLFERSYLLGGPMVHTAIPILPY